MLLQGFTIANATKTIKTDKFTDAFIFLLEEWLFKSHQCLGNFCAAICGCFI